MAAAGTGLLLGISEASAAENGLTQDGQICMQKVFGAPVTNSNRLNCSANDIRISKAVQVSPTSCIKGETFDLTATFEVNVTANARFDAGFFFRTDGGASARGDDNKDASGTCSLSALVPPPPPNSPALQLDTDTCGDLNAGVQQVTFTIPDVVCQAAPGTQTLKLPNCTSWHSNQSTSCKIGNPFDFHPDTKSKCVCDDNFTVPVKVEEATITVTKTASLPQVPESVGGTEVTFTVEVKNNAKVAPVTIASIIDVIGDVQIDLGKNSPPQIENTCPELIGSVLDPGGKAVCSFKQSVTGDTGQSVTDVVKICANQQDVVGQLCDDDDATVMVIDAYEKPTLTKDVIATSDCQVDVLYQVVINNHSPFDTLTVEALDDDRFGDISTPHGADLMLDTEEVVSTDCELLVPIDPNKNYTCTFTGRVRDSSCDFVHTNTVTAYVVDDDDMMSEPSDDATLSLKVTK